MNRDTLAGQWKLFKGNVQSKWGKLTNDDLEVAGGKFETLVGTLQTRYGIAKDKAEAELDDFIKSLKDPAAPKS